MSRRSDVIKLIKASRKKGWEVCLTKKCHYRWEKGGNVFFSSSTPSDHRAMKNIKSNLRKAEENIRIV